MLFLVSDEFAAQIDLAIKGIEPGKLQAFFDAPPPEPLSAQVSIVDGVARVPIHGALSEKPNRFFSMFGGKQTSYSELRATLDTLENDPRVKSAEFDLETPGGDVDGLFKTMRAFRAFSKPTTARITNAHSAGYGLAASMDRRVANSDLSSAGSVGVVASYYTSPNLVTIRSSASPLKNPDPSTDEGKAQIQARIDEVYGFFAAELAQGLPKLGGNYGQGKVFFAASAIRAGLIDEIASAGSPSEEAKMKTFDEARAAFSAEFAAWEQKIKTESAALASEHLKLAEESGAYDIAAKAIAACEPANGAVVLRHQKAMQSTTETAARLAATNGVTVDPNLVAAQVTRDQQFSAAFDREIGKEVA